MQRDGIKGGSISTAGMPSSNSITPKNQTVSDTFFSNVKLREKRERAGVSKEKNPTGEIYSGEVREWEGEKKKSKVPRGKKNICNHESRQEIAASAQKETRAWSGGGRILTHGVEESQRGEKENFPFQAVALKKEGRIVRRGGSICLAVQSGESKPSTDQRKRMACSYPLQKKNTSIIKQEESGQNTFVLSPAEENRESL